MGKYIIAGIAAIFIIVTGVWLMKKPAKDTSGQFNPGGNPPAAVVATSTYATSSLGVSAITYPRSYRVNEGYSYDQFGPKKLIHGVKFLIPDTMATGTNLSAFDTGISIEQLPRAIHCTADIYLADNVRAAEAVINGVTYSVASSSGAGAGNRYEEIIYALANSKPCTALRYFIHSSAIENYDPASGIHEFDRAALLKDFDSIRDSLQLAQ